MSQTPEPEPAACALANALKTRVLRRLKTARDVLRQSAESTDSSATPILTSTTTAKLFLLSLTAVTDSRDVTPTPDQRHDHSNATLSFPGSNALASQNVLLRIWGTMQDLHQQLGRAREVFGKFLRNWRKSNDWVITTPQDWAKACPDIIPPGFRVSSGQWANLENAQIKQAQPSTFMQLALLNQALLSDNRGVINDQLLRQRVAAGQPILKADGIPWGPEHWFACYIGNLQGPEPLWPREQEPDLAEQTQQLRQLFSSLVEQHQLRPITALVQLLNLAGDLDTQQQMAIEGALLQGEVLPQAELQMATQLLARWQERLTAPIASGSRRRRRNDADSK